MYDFLDTPLGKMVAVGDEKALHSLCFYDEILQLDGVQGGCEKIVTQPLLRNSWPFFRLAPSDNSPRVALGSIQKNCRRISSKSVDVSIFSQPQGQTAPIRSIEEELRLYFQGKLKEFRTPIQLAGTEFQKAVWKALKKIPYGKTFSYAEIAVSIGKPLANRAVGNANGKNPFSILIPCHRVIQKDGKLGGYSAGLERKKWLLEHESS